MLKNIHEQLLKVGYIKRAVANYHLRLKKQRHHERWAQLMHTGQKVRNVKPEKLDICDVLPVRSGGGMYEDRLNGKVVGRGYIDSTNWGGIY